MNEIRIAAAGAASTHPGQRTTVTFAELAATLGVAAPGDARLAETAFQVRQVQPGDTVHRAGDRFDAIYVVRAGFFKTVRYDGAGNEQVLGFPMAGDVMGLDAAAQERYTTDAIALDTASVIVVPFGRLARLAHESPAVERLLHGLFSRELVANQRVIWLLGTLHAEARVAAFLLQLSERFGRLGYSRTAFLLRMTRQEMGSYLGLKLETISRTLSAFAAAGLIEIDRKAIRLCDLPRLQRVVEPDGDERRAKRPIVDAMRRVPAAPPAREVPAVPAFA
jgi:CRP/FNR family transcriptional regulator